jgi:hypothetical protein
MDGGDGARNLANQTVAHDGPGRRAYREAVLDWQTAWAKETPMLQCRDVDGILCVEDTRPIAPEPAARVDGLARDVMLLLADEALTRSHLCGRLQEDNGASASAVNEAVDILVQQKLAIDLDNRIVNLVLHAPVPPMPPSWYEQRGSTRT